MKNRVQSRLARFAGMLLLSSIVFAMGVQTVQAALVTDSGTGSSTVSSATATAQAGTQGRGGAAAASTGGGTTASASSASSGSASASTQGLTAAQRHHFFGPPQSVVAVSAAAGTQGRGGVARAQGPPAGGQTSATASRHYIGHFQPTANVLATQTGSSSATSTSAWIAAGSAAAIVLIGLAAWSLTRRRGQSGARPSAAYCAQHPDDSLCSAA